MFMCSVQCKKKLKIHHKHFRTIKLSPHTKNNNLLETGSFHLKPLLMQLSNLFEHKICYILCVLSALL